MISVCMATYNGAKYIREQIDSIICQLDEDDEVVVSDDGSTDDTMAILESYNDTRIKIFRHNRKFANYNSHQKVSANFENAIMQASGDWIFLSDQDDIWAPNKVEKCSQYFEKYDLILSDCCFIIDDKIKYNSSKYNGKDPLWSIIGVPPNYHGCCMSFRSSYKSLILPFPKNLYVHDAWIGHLIRAKGKFILGKDSLVYYRLHSTNVSAKHKRTLFYKVNHRLRIISQIFIRLFSFSLKNIGKKYNA